MLIQIRTKLKAHQFFQLMRFFFGEIFLIRIRAAGSFKDLKSLLHRPRI